MITFKPIIIPGNRRSDGTYVVYVRINHNYKTRRIPTTLICTQSDLTRSLKIKNADILSKADALVARMRDAIKELSPFDLEKRDIDWVVRKIKDSLSEESFSLDFFQWADQYIMCKTETTRRAYSCALNTFERFLGRRSIDINDITRMMLLDFMEFVDNEPKMHLDPKTHTYSECKGKKIPRGASSRHLMKLQHIFNSAKDRYNDEDSGRILIPRSPFDKITKHFPISKGQRNLGKELMQRIIDAQTSDPLVRVSLDAFILSFGLMGANMADMYFATPVKEVWVYERIKTRDRREDRAEMRVEIPAEMKPFIERLQSVKGSWWLPVLHSIAKKKDLCTARVNEGLKRWCEANDVPVFTFYAGRHTWASLARKENVEKATIDECLAHKGSYSITDRYAERNWDLLTLANRKVLDLFTW